MGVYIVLDFGFLYVVVSVVLVLKAALQESDVIFWIALLMQILDFNHFCHYIHISGEYLKKNLIVLIFCE